MTDRPLPDPNGRPTTEPLPADRSSSAAVDGSDPVFVEAYRVARRRVRRLRGWYIHALVYACVIGGLWLLFALQPSFGRFGWPRPLPPTLGWGLGLAIHGLVVWMGSSLRGRQWESRKIDEYLQAEIAARGTIRR